MTLAGLALLLLLLTGCGPFFDQYNLQDRADQVAGVLGNRASVGESFVSHCNGLSALDFQVAIFPSAPPSSGVLTLSLWEGSSARGAPVATERTAESTLRANQWIRFSFAPIPDSQGKLFLVRAQATDPGRAPVTLWATSHLSAPEQHRFTNAEKVPGALVYRAYCSESPVQVAGGTFAAIERAGWLWPIALMLCIVPGLGFATLISRDDEDPAAFLGLALGWSVLLAPVALAVATPLRAGVLMGLPLLVIGGGLFFWYRPKALRWSPWAVVAVAATLVALVIRAIDARGLVAPMWGDPVQHSYVTALILHDRGIPATYGALVPPQVFDYHFGFQTLAAYAAWLSGAGPANAVLAMGQILDALIALALYRFARDLTGSPRAGAVAAILVALVTTQPAYFITWGRYPELAALVALPAAAAALRGALNSTTVRAVAIASLAAAALIVVHPRVAVFLACLGVAFVASELFGKGSRRRHVAAMVLRLVLVGAGSLILVAPWAIRLWTAHEQLVTRPLAWQPVNFPVGLATGGNDRWVLGLAVVALAISIARRPALAVLLTVWAALVLVLANPATFRLPLSLFVNNGSLAIALFVPAAILVGFLFEVVAQWAGHFLVNLPYGSHAAAGPAPRRNQRAAGKMARWGVAGLLFCAGLTQAPALTTVVNPCCVLVRPGDLAAIDWVRRNTPPDARFLINGYRWQGSAWMGSDAGYWLPVLARRRTSLPPLFYAVGPAGQVAQIDAVAAQVQHDADDPSALATLARHIGAGYVFIGTRGGVLDPGRLAASDRFRLVYQSGGAWVFEVISGRGDIAQDGGSRPHPELCPKDTWRRSCGIPRHIEQEATHYGD